jgi:NAD(P)H-binding
MRIFLTGGTGYIGSAVARTLIGQGHDVVGHARSPTSAARLRRAGVEPVLGALDDQQLLRRALSGADAIVLAAFHLVEVKADNPVKRRERLGLESLEHPSSDPLVAPGPQRRVRHLVVEDRLDIHPRDTGHQPDQDPPEAHPIRHPAPVTTQRMGLDGLWQQGLNSPPDDIDHLRVERAHDVGYLHRVVVMDSTRHQTGPSRRPVDSHLSARLLSTSVPSTEARDE